MLAEQGDAHASRAMLAASAVAGVAGIVVVTAVDEKRCSVKRPAREWHRASRELEVRDRRGLGAQCASVRVSRSARESPEHLGRVCEWRCVLERVESGEQAHLLEALSVAQLQRERSLLSTRARRSAAWTDRSASNSSTNVPGLGSR